MPMNIDFGVSRAVLAALREKGVPAADAARIFSTNSTKAFQVFGQAFNAFGASKEGATAHALAALKTWAQTLRR